MKLQTKSNACQLLNLISLFIFNKSFADANKTGVTKETIQNISRMRKTMTEEEARQILGISEQSSWDEILQVYYYHYYSLDAISYRFRHLLTASNLQKYNNLFENNEKNGSFYLQSKVHRAKECLEAAHQSSKAEGTSS